MTTLAATVTEIAHTVAELRQHYVLWWELANPENRAKWKAAFSGNCDFFDPTARAHFQAVIVTSYQLLDDRSGVVSLRAILAQIEPYHAALVTQSRALISPHQGVFDRMDSIRHKVFAHRDRIFGPETIFELAGLTPEGIGACVDTLCRVTNDLYVSLIPEREQLEFYDEADHRANCAADDCRRILAAL